MMMPWVDAVPFPALFWLRDFLILPRQRSTRPEMAGILKVPDGMPR